MKKLIDVLGGVGLTAATVGMCGLDGNSFAALALIAFGGIVFAAVCAAEKNQQKRNRKIS